MEFIVFGGIIFWILTALLSVGVISSIHTESGKWATISFIAYVIILAVFGSFDIIGFISQNPIMIAIIFGSYFAAGIVWTFLKWHLYVSDARRNFDEYRANWLEGRGFTDGKVPDEIKAEWKIAAQRYSEKIMGRRFADENQTGTQIVNNIKPKVRSNKSRIIFWLSYWPFSLLYSVLADGIMAIWNRIYHGIGKYLQKISDKQFDGIDADFE